MREQLQQYVALLFAGVQGCEDIQQEILQNTLDRYDDLIAQGKVPEAAYRLAISGIGDINEILGTAAQPNVAASVHMNSAPPQQEEDTQKKRWMRAIGIALYILCPVPVILLGSMGGDMMGVFGVCCLLLMVAAATVLMILGAEKDTDEEEPKVPAPLKRINDIVSTAALVLFFVVSFLTHAWYITWLIFPIAGAVKNLIRAIYDYREENRS